MTHTELTLTPEEILEHWPTQGALWLMEDPLLFEHHADAFIAAIKTCTAIPEHQTFLVEMAKTEPVMIRAAVANNVYIATSVLQHLAMDRAEHVRKEVAKNINTPSCILERLAEEQDWEILCCIATHANTSPRTLQTLVDKHSDYYLYVVYDASERYVWHPYHVCHAIAKHVRTPTDALSKLSHDENPQIRVAVADNINTSSATLEHLAKDSWMYVRKAVASNTNAPIAILKQLAEDKNKDVRKAASQNLKMA